MRQVVLSHTTYLIFLSSTVNTKKLAICRLACTVEMRYFSSRGMNYRSALKQHKTRLSKLKRTLIKYLYQSFPKSGLNSPTVMTTAKKLKLRLFEESRTIPSQVFLEIVTFKLGLNNSRIQLMLLDKRNETFRPKSWIEKASYYEFFVLIPFLSPRKSVEIVDESTKLSSIPSDLSNGFLEPTPDAGSRPFKRRRAVRLGSDEAADLSSRSSSLNNFQFITIVKMVVIVIAS